MIITLDEELSKMLQEQAIREGRDTDTVARELLAASIREAARDFSEAVEGIRRGFEDFEAGRYRSLAEVRAEKKAKYGIGIPPSCSISTARVVPSTEFCFIL